jgi:hypothetical protein
MEMIMVHAFSRLLTIALCGDKRKKHPQRMEDWFRIEYGKEWRSALAHYSETGSIHWKN